MRNWQFCALLMLGICAPWGCSSQPPQEDDTTQDLRQIARAYEVILAEKKRPPRDAEEITTVLTGFHAAGITPAPADVLTSGRDGQPYVIIYGVDLGATATPEILAYEQKGADGGRYVLTLSRDVHLLSDDEFKQASFANNHRPSGA